MVKKAKNYTSIRIMCYELRYVHDLTSDQVHGRSTSNVVRKRLVYVRVCFTTFLKTLILERLLLGTDLQIKFHNLTILLNIKLEMQTFCK